MKKLLLYFPLLILFLFSSCGKEEETEKEHTLPNTDPYIIDWKAAADSSTATLIERFWNESGNYFNYGNDSSNKDFHYWPQAHAMDVIIDAYLRTQNKKYRDYFDKWYKGIKARNNNSYWNNFYDDMEWIALTMIRLYDTTEDTKYLNTAQEMWTEIKTGWNDYAGGGIAWQHNEPWSKNACSNGPASLLACRLYQISKNEADKEWALKIYNWQKEHLFNPATGAVYDNINGQTGDINKVALSYNQGTFLGTAYELYKITGDDSYLDEACITANFNVTDPGMLDKSNNLLRDEGTGDNGLFKAVFIRYFVKLLTEADLGNSYRKKFVDFFDNNAEVLWNKGVNKRDLLYGTSWAKGAILKTQLTTQTSGCTMIEAKALYEKTK